jgi:superfamily II DNA or RNA helicase/diadenosine tetraphosphate (Ap4A) HIT family hydrolase
MSEADPCPFCLPAEDRVAFVTALTKGIWDAFPVTEGHLLIVPHRHVPSWRDLQPSEQAAMLDGVSRAQTLIAERVCPDGFNVGFNEGEAAGQTIPHFHIHVIPRRIGDMNGPRGGVRHVIPHRGNYFVDTPRAQSTASPLLMGTPHGRGLIAGGEDALLRHLLPHIDQARAVDLAVSFVLESGARLLQPHLQELLNRSGRLRLVTSDYLDITDPTALRRLMDLEGDAELMVFEATKVGFHPKSWVFHLEDQSGVAIVGSSNLSASALRTGVEWNYRVCSPDSGQGWQDVLDGFETLIQRAEIRPLDHDWIDRYEQRRAKAPPPTTRLVDLAPEPDAPPPRPHAIQVAALEALEETRSKRFTAGLVVLATGLGKTWLSAFDTNRPEFKRVLFVAHREEILSQAMETYRRCRPKARFGRYSGSQKDLDADVLFASIQTLGKAAHLRQFSPDAFDYIVVDEFHHAAARTYRGLIEHFTPKFLLGLTATPDRMDGADLLGLCQENLIYRCDFLEGIEQKLLSGFLYMGVPDDVNYAQIPWRGSGFDETALTQALATQARAQNALEQLQLHGGKRTLGFCCSQRHANFMANYFEQNGLRAVSVHSGPSSAPRASSLERLEAGELDAVFSVDMFNEGVDVPNIDTVLMLRPTESTVIWLQQFGRGLRRCEGKKRLIVIDYIGNHRTFLTKARALLRCSKGDRALAFVLEELRRGEIKWPEGCEVTYDLKALDLLTGLLKGSSRGDALEAYYLDFRERTGERPKALDIYHAGFKPRTTGHGDWLSFVDHQGDLSGVERQVLERHRGLLDTLATMQMKRSHKILLVQAMQREGAFPGAIEVDQLAARMAQLAARNPSLRRDINADLSKKNELRRIIETGPIAAWVEGWGASGRRYFTYKDGLFSTAFEATGLQRQSLNDLVEEIVDWRLADYLGSDPSDPEVGVAEEPETPFEGPQPLATQGASLWREYMREEIPGLYGLKFSTGSWNQGFVVQGDKHVFLLVTLKKDGLQEAYHYGDRFIDAWRFHWKSQNRTTQASAHGQIISGQRPNFALHLFVRAERKRGLNAAPFVYCGDVQFESWEGEKPIAVNWRLAEPVPKHLHRTFQIAV